MEVVICFDWGGKVFGRSWVVWVGEVGCLGGGSGLFGWWVKELVGRWVS